MRQQSFVLDSYALLAYFQAEAGGSSVRDILKQARENRAQAFLSLLNLVTCHVSIVAIMNTQN